MSTSSTPDNERPKDAGDLASRMLRRLGVPEGVTPRTDLTGCDVCDGREPIEDVLWFARHDLCLKHETALLMLRANEHLRRVIPPRHHDAREVLPQIKEFGPEVSLYLFGDVGRGKTYQAATWLKRAWMHDARDGSPPTIEWWYVPDLLDLLRSRKLEVGDVGRTKYLVLDDLGAERQTEWAGEVILKLMQRRYDDAAGGMCITSNLNLGELAHGLTPADDPHSPHGKRIASRIAEMCKQVEVTGPDRRLTGGKA